MFSLLQNGILTSDSPVTEEGRVLGCLSASCAVRNLILLERAYTYRGASHSFDETLLLLSPSPPEGNVCCACCKQFK
jgi:hypothetical protein